MIKENYFFLFLKNVNKKRKAISPLIAMILLIVVSVSIVVVLFSWGQTFTGDSLSISSDITYDSSDIEGFIKQSQRIRSGNLIIENLHSTIPITVIGYKINSNYKGHYLNKNLFFEDDFNLSPVTIYPNQIKEIYLVCFPENEFNLELILNNNTYTNVRIRENNFNLDDCLLSQPLFILTYDYTPNQDQITISLNDIFQGATVMYTLDGSTPTLENGNLYTSDIIINQSLTFKAKSFKEGYKATEVIEKEIFICDNNSFNGFFQGDGSLDNPYGICNCQMLQNINNYLDSNYKLLTDIECSQTTTWNDGEGFVPIANSDFNFSGIFNGNNYKIKDLFINTPLKENVSLFVTTDYSSEIFDLKLKDVNLIGYKNVGGLVVNNYGTLSNIEITGSVYAKHDFFCDMMGCFYSGGEYAGGLATRNYGTILKSGFDGFLKADLYLGGLLSVNKGIVEESYSKGYLSGITYVGGLIGYMHGEFAYVKDSYSEVAINLDNRTDGMSITTFFSGGFIGNFINGTIENSYANNSVSISEDITPKIGVFSGFASTDVLGSHDFKFPNIINSYSVTKDFILPSFYNEDFIFIYAFIYVHSSSFSGPDIPPEDYQIINSYWDQNVSSNFINDFEDEYFGEETSFNKTTQEMKQKSTFIGWDFDTIWAINEGETYPYLRQNTQYPLPQ